MVRYLVCGYPILLVVVELGQAHKCVDMNLKAIVPFELIVFVFEIRSLAYSVATPAERS